ncbi:hypothetical protein ACGFJ7_39750 [Actinoplanes sp. NPDC048988]|uniref:hypothetical protein n=1 Tax=Actinoplanes sp. NPDC048988 TaxID=3363901 RepID=UPI00371D6EE1
MLNFRSLTVAASCMLVLAACSSEPDKVEQASSAGESAAPAQEAAAKPTGSLLQTGFGQRDEYVSVVALVKNTSAKVGQTVTVQFNVTDAAGEILGSESQVEYFSRPDQVLPVLTQVDVSGKKAAKVEATLLVEDNGTFDSEPFPEIPAKATIAKSEYGDGYTARVQVSNPKAEPLKNPHITVVCYDAAKKIVGGGFTFPDMIPPSGKAVAQVDLLTAGKPARCDAYGTPSAI